MQGEHGVSGYKRITERSKTKSETDKKQINGVQESKNEYTVKQSKRGLL
jgi:hypothetical protein